MKNHTYSPSLGYKKVGTKNVSLILKIYLASTYIKHRTYLGKFSKTLSCLHQASS